MSFVAEWRAVMKTGRLPCDLDQRIKARHHCVIDSELGNSWNNTIFKYYLVLRLLFSLLFKKVLEVHLFYDAKYFSSFFRVLYLERNKNLCNFIVRLFCRFVYLCWFIDFLFIYILFNNFSEYKKVINQPTIARIE